MNLEEARQTWIKERPLYAEFIAYIKTKIEAEVKKLGIWRRIDGRPKEVDSLIKKMIVKKKRYDEVFDKAGVRVILRFDSELEGVCATLETLLHIIKRENTSERYGLSGFGYRAIHYEVKLKEDDAEIEKYRDVIAEVQVKSLSQSLWAEMAHELAYKANILIPDSIKRRLVCLNALLEVADMEFERINHDIQHLPSAEAHQILATLERQFLKLAGTEYNKELSLDVIEALIPLYGATPVEQQAEHFKDFYEQQVGKLDFIFREHQGDKDQFIFLFQPESIMIFDLLSTDKFSLEEAWSSHFPIEELEKMATLWGSPLVH